MARKKKPPSFLKKSSNETIWFNRIKKILAYGIPLALAIVLYRKYGDNIFNLLKFNVMPRYIPMLSDQSFDFFNPSVPSDSSVPLSRQNKLSHLSVSSNSMVDFPPYINQPVKPPRGRPPNDFLNSHIQDPKTGEWYKKYVSAPTKKSKLAQMLGISKLEEDEEI